MHRFRFLSLLAVLLATPALAADGNRLTYLDELDPYGPSRKFPKLVTPQWVGEDGVEAVVILAIDDMRGHERWEAYLRPILKRLKKIDGRAPVSIMTCQIDPNQPHLQTWLKEGVSLETHTFDHPCPILRGGDLAKAKATYDRCVDLLAEVPNSRPVAFRTPCCDSMNAVSPRLFAEVFNKTTPMGNFLQVDSSVFHVYTSNDPALPRDLVIDADGQDRFLKYLPRDRSFVNYIEDYPYPYVIGRQCWEFPCMTPSDWQAQHRHKPNNPVTVSDWKAALDCTVIKQGVFCMVFHPHGWITAEQVNDFIDHAVTQHGRKVKFLTFREALERLNTNLLGGQPLREAKKGWDNGVRLLDLDNDGFLDVVVGNERTRQTRLWVPKARRWTVGDFPAALVTGDGDAGARFGILHSNELASFYVLNEKIRDGWTFNGKGWDRDGRLTWPEEGGEPVLASREGRDRGVRLRDLDGDGACELLVANERQRAAFRWYGHDAVWGPRSLPPGAAFVDAQGRDQGLRFLDLDGDGREDVLFSNDQGFGVYLFTSMRDGWFRKVLAGKPGDKGALPLIARNGTNNGFWVHSRQLWWQNEDTALLPNHVDRRSFNDLLRDVEPGPKSPEASLRSIRTRPGFQVELVAAEPLVQDPIAFAWGPDGKFWVVEMGDYPLGLDGKGKPGGRVKFLEDTDGDGKYDKASIFLDGLGFPTGVMPWRKGVLVTCAPDILYAEDTDGDGKADKRKVLFTGFLPGNQQHRVNTLAWGLDNWVYCANGDSGGLIHSPQRKQGPLNISGRDFRIRPDTGEIDAQTGQTQFGRCRDDWGNWFGGNNSNPLWHFALEDHYLRRNPHVAPPNPRVPVPVQPGVAPVYPISRTLPRFNDWHTANRFTSACSPTVYRDDLFGPHFVNNTFVCEPVHNLVHREIMTAKGFTFTSQRPVDEQQSEFLASSDNWFRPVFAQTGPDGALWIADMYRHVIEHPQWIPQFWQKKLDLRAGHDKGRIYRVYPVVVKPRAIPRLDKLDTAGLVAALDSPSGWQRDMAQQMLIWRDDKAAVPLLEKQAWHGRRPSCRLHSLCALDGMGQLKAEPLHYGAADPHAGVRRHATRLAEPLFATAALLGAGLTNLTTDFDPQVRLQLAYTLGQWDDVQAGKALGEMLLRDGHDPYFLAAALSSVTKKNLDTVLAGLLTEFRERPGRSFPSAVFDQLLRLAHAVGDSRATVALLRVVGAPEKIGADLWRLTALGSFLDALDQRNTSLEELHDAADAELKAAIKGLDGAFDYARRALMTKSAPPEARPLAFRLMGRGREKQEDDIILMGCYTSHVTPGDLQAAAVAALGRLHHPRAAEELLFNWKSHGPALRPLVVDALLGREERVQLLLDAVEKKQILPTEIDAARRQRLHTHKTTAIRERAGKLLVDAVNPDRQKVLDAFRPVLTLKGDAGRGKPLFTKHCAACHKFEGQGNDVGPDIGSVGDKSPEALLVAFLDPNRAVEARYLNYVAETKNGQTLSGVLTNETGTSITLVGADGKPQVVLRTDLEALASTGKSAMPEGLEKDVTPQDMADVIAYVRAGAPAPQRKTFAGNKPGLVKPAADGSLHLRASNCEIYGRTLVLEEKHSNLGYWSSTDDHVVWEVEVPRAGHYAVWLEWACDDKSAGNTFVLAAGVNTFTARVEGTGGWDTYRNEKVGTMALAEGRQRVTMRAEGNVSGALIDLKGIRLIRSGN